MQPANNNKIKCIFVGSFKDTIKGRGVGGVMTACKTLLSSPISDRVDWIKIDTTETELPPASLFVRSVRGLKRLVLFAFHAANPRVQHSLIFVSFLRFSLLEKGFMILISRLFRVRCVVFIRSDVTDIGSTLVGKVIRRMLSSSDAILVQSAINANALKRYLGGEHVIQVIPNWINLDEYAFASVSEQNIVAGHIVFMGRLEEYKNVKGLIEAFELARKEFPTSQLHLCGDGSLRKRLESYARDLHMEAFVIFHGWVSGSTRKNCLRQAQVFALASRSDEGMPNVLLEAMSCGIPVVATRVGGVPNLITDEVDGLLVDPGSTEQLANAIIRLLKDSALCQSLGANGRKTIEKGHDVDALWTVVYDSIVNG